MTARSAARHGRLAARRAWTAVRHEWQAGRLSLRDLPSGARHLSRLVLALIAATAAIIILRALGLVLPGPSFTVPSGFLGGRDTSTIPVLPFVLACTGIAAAAAALAIANQRSAPRLSRVAILAIAVLALAQSSHLVTAAGDLARLEGVLAPNQSIAWPPASLLIGAGGWLGAASAAAAICLVLLRTRMGGPGLLASLASAPFAMAASLVVIVGYESLEVGRTAPGVPPAVAASAYVAPAFAFVADVVKFWLLPLGLWQAVTWARATRQQVGERIATRDGRWPWLLGAVLTAKTGWLVLGYSTTLPASLGGASPLWERSRADGIVAWLIAVGFAAVAGWWLASERRVSVSERGFTPAAILVVVGFSAVSVLMSFALVGIPIARLLPNTPTGVDFTAACAGAWPSEAVGNAVTCLLVRATDWQYELTILVQLGTLVTAIAVVATLWRRQRWRSTVLFLAAVVVWVAPRVPDVVRDLLRLPPAPSVAPELVTFDTALTIVLVVLGIAWYTGRQRGAGPAALLLVTVVSTLLVHAGTVVPPAAGRTLFFLALLFPIVYGLLFDSEAVNRRHPDRPARVLERLGVRLGVISLVALGVVLGTVEASEASLDQVGRVLFAVPFSALLVAATLSRRFRPAIDRAGLGDPQPSPTVATAARGRTRVVGLGVVGAAAALAIMVGMGAAADTILSRVGVDPAFTGALPGASSATPSMLSMAPAPTQRLAEFVSRTSTTHALVQDRLTQIAAHLETGTDRLAQDVAALDRLVADEREWLREHPAASCYAPAVNAWQLVLDRTSALNDRIAAMADSQGPEAQQAIEEALREFSAADASFLDSVDAAVVACRGIASPAG